MSVLVVTEPPMTSPAGVMISKCPLDETALETPGRVVGQQTGLRLDLRPVGEGALERPLTRCPRCQLIVDPHLVGEDDREAARRLVATASYQEEARGRSDHALRALLVAELRPQSSEVAFEWLRASWELEGGAAAPWRRATERALAAFVLLGQQPVEMDFDFDGVSSLEQRRTAQLMQVELLRRLERIPEALAALDAFAVQPELQRGAYATLVRVERSLLERKDSSPQPFPDVAPFDPKEDDPAHVAASHLGGWTEFDAEFTLERARFDTHHGQRNSIHSMIDAREDRPLDGAWWFNTAQDGAPQFTWTQFLAAHARAERLVLANPWLLDWKRAGPQRHLELWLGGLGTDLDDMNRLAWDDAGFRADPVAEIILREDHLAVATVYLAVAGGGIATSVNEKRTLDHWLTAQPFFFHPRGDPPTYLRVEASGKWAMRVLGRVEDPQADALEERLKRDPLHRKVTP